MNAQNAAQFLPLVQALADGKTIQLHGNRGWEDVEPPGNIGFNFPIEDYRIKPELPKPRECWRNYYAMGPGGGIYPSREKADASQIDNRAECVHFREVLPETP